MSKKWLKVSALVISTALLATTFIGCGKKEDTSKATTSAAASSAAASTAAASAEFTYPMNSTATLKYWVEINSNVSGKSSNLGDTPFAKGLAERTGIKVEYIHPASNSAKETLNILIASGDLPDIIENNWYDMAGGPEKYVKDGYILKLNETIDKYSPNLKKVLTADKELDKMVKTDSGSYYVYPFIRGHESLMVYQGLFLRKDWLTDLNLQVPETIDEWYNVLKAFKEKKNVPSPLDIVTMPNTESGNMFKSSAAFVGAYGINYGFFVENGKVKYGPAEPAFKEFIKLMRQWYSEGLISKSLPLTDKKTLDANISSGKSGATIGNLGGGIKTYMDSMKDKDAKFDLVGAPYPVLKKGDKPKFSQMDLPYNSGSCAAISAKSKNIEAAARLLDYGYSQKGGLYFNFGTENVSYKMENGVPKYTDLVKNNPDKLPMAVAAAQYIRGNYGGPFVQEKAYADDYLFLIPQQKDAIAKWLNTDNKKYLLPKILPTPEESSEMSRIMTDIKTAVDENFFKMITGSESVDNFDKYIENLKKFKLDQALKIQQDALDRYSKR